MKTKYALLLMAALATGCGGQQKPDKKGLAQKGGAAPVEIIVIAPQSIDRSLTFSGTLMANEEVEVRPETSGRVVSIAFEEGQNVTKGKVLASTDDTELQAQLRKNTALAGQAQSELARRKALLASRGISQEEYDATLAKYESLAAEQDLIKAQIYKTSIKAPFHGKVGFRMVSDGAFVSSQTIITTLQQTDPIKLEFSVPEQYAKELRASMPLEFTVEGSDRVWKSTVYAIEPRIDLATRTIKLRARCNNADGALIPGAFARVKLNLFAGKESLIIPASSIIPVLNGQQVYAIESGKAVIRDVTMGRRTSQDVEITSGLSTGDSLIITGLLQIKPGMAVKPIVNQKNQSQK